MESTVLFDKIYGSLIGSAIGDAMGGPVECLHYETIQKNYGFVDDLLPYNDVKTSAHGPFELHAGAYTDDSRMSKILAGCIINKNGCATSKDVAKGFIDYYYSATNELEKDFMEEYYLKAIYTADKEVFGGQPTNGAIMGIAPFGIISACNPQKAHDNTFEAMFFATGFARYATAMAAGGIARAMCKGATHLDVEAAMLNVAKEHKKHLDGARWRTSFLYEGVAQKSENLVKKAIDIAEKYDDVVSIQKELYDGIVQEFFADAAESLAIAAAFLHVGKGDFTKTITGCVNFGRDNDSSASIAGAMAGALNGASAIHKEWIDLVEAANKGPTFYELATKLHKIIVDNYEAEKAQLAHLGELI